MYRTNAEVLWNFNTNGQFITGKIFVFIIKGQLYTYRMVVFSVVYFKRLPCTILISFNSTIWIFPIQISDIENKNPFWSNFIIIIDICYV